MTKQYTEQPLLEFNPKLPQLSKSEKAVLKLLVEAGKLIVPIYSDQESQLKERGNFYPAGVSKEEVDRSAKTDPAILSPYTVIEKTDGRLEAIPYHIKYAKLLKPIAEKLIQASEITDNKEFGRFLKLQAKALTDGSYEKATIAWLQMKPYIIDVSIGPLEHWDDQVFFTKAAYQAWIGVIDIEKTKKFDNYKKIILSARREALIPGERINTYEKVKVKAIDVLLMSGFMARFKFVGMNLPMNLKLIEKYGTDVTVFNQINDLRLKEQILPTFKKIFSPQFQKCYSLDDLKRGSLRYVALHELAHDYLYYKNSAKNLQDLFHYIFELTATLLGMRIAGSLLLQDVITSKQLESMVVAFICRSYDLIEKSKTNKSLINYSLGGDVFINFMLKSGAIKQRKGMTVPNFMRIFVALHELAYMLERILSSGTREDAEALIRKYG